MKKIWMIALCLLGLMVTGHAQADEAQEYNEGYNAGYENQSPPDSTSSLEYYNGWNEGYAAASKAENPPPAEQSQTDDQQ
jgi:hypothetical protein